MAHNTPVSTAARLDKDLGTVRQQEELIQRLLREKYEPIALVGMGLRFPGDNNSLDDLTEFLQAGDSATVPVPADRWDAGELTGGGAGGFLDRIDLFDARFFNISPREANWIDPQQRMILETAWEALEHANIDPQTLRHSNGGVYIGVSNFDYVMELDGIDRSELDGMAAPGSSHAGVCGRLSYFLGWRGPSISIDTACSASLVALHYAVQGLRHGECDIALCGGVNAIHHPRTSMIFSDMKALSSDGRCKTFDDSADGYGRAEGCGVMVLKRLSDAKRDGDTVLALIRGTAVSHDGESAGLTVPNGLAQEVTMRRALAAAALEPKDIQFVEAHGTGTPLGDPIEMGAINDVFADSHSPSAPIVVSSHKANIGHMETAAGVGGVAKVVAQMRVGTLFPHINLTQPSSRIPWKSYSVAVPTEGRPWQPEVRRALVNSFGITGTIASAVLEEAPRSAAPEPAKPSQDGAGHVFTLSAKTQRSLILQIERYQALLSKNPDLDVESACYTGSVGRSHFAHRLAGVVHDDDGLSRLLADRLGVLSQGNRPAKSGIRKVAFLFTGQGSQHIGMGAGLYRRHCEFRRVVDECDALFAPHLGRSIKTMMFGEATDAEGIHRTRYTQPALFVLEYALAKLWMSWGVRPSVMTGHSIGEIVAASVAGLFSLPDAVRMVAARAALMDSVTAPGAMAAVQAPVDTVGPLLDPYPDLAVAAINTPSQCVISGDRTALDKVVAELEQQGIKAKRLTVSHAFHSPLMNQMAEEFRAVVETIEFREPELAFVSNVTGELARWRHVSRPDYWVRHVTEPVDFMAGMHTVERRGPHVFIEVGPAATLSSMAKRCLPAKEQVWLTSLQPAESDDSTLLKAVARMYETGLPFSWQAFYGDTVRHKATLPTYAFDRKRYWLPTVGRERRVPGETAPQPERGAIEAPAATPVTPSLNPEELARLTTGERQAAIAESVRARVAHVLGSDDVSEVENDADFSELGLDSLGALQLRDALQAVFPVTLVVSELFAHSTVRRLADFIDQQFDAER
ncbi:type I polyketide synthase [Streptomyces sp. NPDC004296]|uniref:type I polyketide synthase n=1 Tax=Streptomyces sp. NPDC004296 TaxID=3364697 RepID=UPI00368791D2